MVGTYVVGQPAWKSSSEPDVIILTLRKTSTQVVETSVATNNSPPQDYTNLDNQSTTNIDLPGSQPTTVLLRTIPAQMINQPQTLTHLSHNLQQSSELHQHGQLTNYKHWFASVQTGLILVVTTANLTSQTYNKTFFAVYILLRDIR